MINLDIDSLPYEELKQLADIVNKKLKQYQLTPKSDISIKNPCQSCKNHTFMPNLSGGKDWMCTYNKCRYDFKNANPSVSGDVL